MDTFFAILVDLYVMAMLLSFLVLFVDDLVSLRFQALGSNPFFLGSYIELRPVWLYVFFFISCFFLKLQISVYISSIIVSLSAIYVLMKSSS